MRFVLLLLVSMLGSSLSFAQVSEPPALTDFLRTNYHAGIRVGMRVSEFESLCSRWGGQIHVEPRVLPPNQARPSEVQVRDHHCEGPVSIVSRLPHWLQPVMEPGAVLLIGSSHPQLPDLIYQVTFFTSGISVPNYVNPTAQEWSVVEGFMQVRNFILGNSAGAQVNAVAKSGRCSPNFLATATNRNEFLRGLVCVQLNSDAWVSTDVIFSDSSVTMSMMNASFRNRHQAVPQRGVYISIERVADPRR